MSDMNKVSPEMQAAWVSYEPVGEFRETMSFAKFNGMLRHAFMSGFASGIEARSGETAHAGSIEDESLSPQGDAQKEDV